MDIIIIEDEDYAARDLRRQIEKLRPDFRIQAVLDSVESAVAWFSGNPQPNLIFSDIQLGDGLSFEIFSTVKIDCPVIFCTAFDEYAIQAFKNNGIDYLLKPILEKDLAASLKRIEQLRENFRKLNDTDALQRILGDLELSQKRFKKALLIPYRERLIPIDVSDIYLVRLTDETTQVCTHDNKVFVYHRTLDVLEKQLNPEMFYRANRQHIISYAAIKDVESDSERKLKVNLKLSDVVPVLISKAKASDFLRWMGER